MGKSKARDIHLYARAFFRYDDQSQIDIKFLSKELGVSGYRLTGMVRAAKKMSQ